MLEIARASTPAARTQPHNLDAERSVLGAVFIKPSAFDVVATTLQVDDFFLPAHREIFDAMLALDGRRQPIDVIAVADELKTRGMLAHLEGGETYLLALLNATPTAENASYYARLVKDKATLRRLIVACAEVQSSAYGDFGEFGAFIGDSIAKVSAVANRIDAASWVTTVQRALALGKRSAPMATGLRTLDANTRGGLREGLVVLGGAPGAGKTALALQLALHYALAGCAVTVLASDEEPDDLLIRIGQALGFAREALEAADPEVLSGLAQRLEALPHLVLLDGADTTVETAARELNRRANGGPSILMVDSIQTVMTASSADADGVRARIDGVVAALKAAGRGGLTVVATCELARGAYRSRNPAERTEALAAFKESGAIEYAAKLALVLTSAKDEVGVVDVEVVKNRWGSGRRAPMRLVLNFEGATFTETAAPEEGGDDVAMNLETELAADMAKARAILRKTPGVPGNDQLIALLGVSKTRGRTAVRALWEAGEIENRGQGKSRRLFLVTANSPNSPNSPGDLGGFNSPNSPRPYIGAGVGASNPGEQRTAAPWAGPGEQDAGGEDVV
jgi:replicative DNA helicase